MLFRSQKIKQHKSVRVVIVCHFCRHCRDVRSDVCHGSTFSSADCLWQLNHAHKSWPTLSITWPPPCAHRRRITACHNIAVTSLSYFKVEAAVADETDKHSIELSVLEKHLRDDFAQASNSVYWCSHTMSFFVRSPLFACLTDLIGEM